MEIRVAQYRRVASVDAIPAGMGTVVEVDGKKVAIFNVEGRFYAVDNACSHRGGPLGEGSLRGNLVNCPWHGAQFDITNGQVLSFPATEGIASYSTKVDQGGIWVAIC